jgi:small GTP-binding protein
MPLFKRRQDKPKTEEQPKLDEKEAPEEEKAEGAEDEAPGEEGEESPGDPVEEALDEVIDEVTDKVTEDGAEESTEDGAEESTEDGAEEAAEEDEDEDEMSIDELLEAAGTADRPSELGETVGDLTGEDVHLVKMARKVVVIGDPAVGKTSLIKRFVQDVFDDRYLNTIGAKVMKKELGVNRPDTGEIVDLKLILWDIAGQETFDNVKKAYYRGASGAIVVCDLTRRETMENMHRWIENLFDVSDVIPMVIICNKNDLAEDNQFDVEAVEGEYAPYGAPVFSTSAKQGDNVEMVFHEIGKMISK